MYEDAVPLEKFFDRGEEVEFFVRNVRVKRKMLLCVVAPLKYGKSSLLKKYLDILRGFPDVISVYVDLKIVDKPIEFLVGELRKVGIDLEEDYLGALRRGSLLKFFEKLGECLEKRQAWLFLFFDEFHLLPERVKREGFYRKFEFEDIFGFFRGFAEGRRISYVVCGSVIEPLMRALDVWGGRFQIIYLGPFGRDDAIEMLKKLFSEGGMEISDEDAEMIAEATGYHPFYIQYIGHYIYAAGSIDRRSIIEAKEKLYEFLAPIFEVYIKRIFSMGEEYLRTLGKIIRKELLTLKERTMALDMLRMGILRLKNARYEIIDPLFRRYVEQILEGREPTEVLIVGHRAERIVGSYLARQGYMPYYSHESRGAFDIYVKIMGRDVGIQVKYSSTGKVRLSEEEAEEIKKAAEEQGWTPILAVVSKKIGFFKDIRPREYVQEEGEEDIKKLLE